MYCTFTNNNWSVYVLALSCVPYTIQLDSIGWVEIENEVATVTETGFQ